MSVSGNGLDDEERRALRHEAAWDELRKSPGHAERAERAEELYLAASRLYPRQSALLRQMGCQLIAAAARLDEALETVTDNLCEGYEAHGYFAYECYAAKDLERIEKAIAQVQEALGASRDLTAVNPSKLESAALQLDLLLHNIHR